MVAKAISFFAREDIAKRLHDAKAIGISPNGEPVYVNRHSGKNAKRLASLRNRMIPISFPGKEARNNAAILTRLKLRGERQI